MTKSLATLIDTAYRIKVALCIGSYELRHYEDGSIVVFRVHKSFDPAVIVNIAGALDLRIYADGSDVAIALYEKFIEE